MLLDYLIKETESNNQEYKKWLENQIDKVYSKEINSQIVSEIGISKNGLVVYIYTLPDCRQKGYFKTLLEQVEKDYLTIDFWTYNKNIQCYLQERKNWNRKKLLIQNKRNYIQYAYNHS